MCSIILTGFNSFCITRRLYPFVTSGTFKLPSNYFSDSKFAESEEKRVPNGDDARTGAPQADQDPVQLLKKENISLVERVKEIDDKFKRALADGENTRVRMRKQIEEAKIFGIQSFCKDLLEVADILDKALESVSQEETRKSPALNDLYIGVKMTSDQLQTIFRRHGLVQINPLGDKFNPNDHHAMFEASVPGKEPGTVSVVTQIGYKLKDRTIRPAMVGVVKAD